MTIYCGLDNGTTGSIGMVGKDGFSKFYQMPIIKQQNYTKAKQMITRIDNFQLGGLLTFDIYGSDIKVLIERPMVNPKRFKASTSALRALESTLLAVESRSYPSYPYQYIDSKEWQKVMLPKGVKGTPELKKASLDISCRLFPKHKALIIKHGDGDGLLIAEFARKMAW